MRKIINCIPNTITLLNLLSGVMACIMTFSLDDELACGLTGMYWAMIFIGAAALFDFMDGAMARLLHAYSDLGKELDSLADLVSFGVAPALLLFNFVSSCAIISPVWVPYVALFIPAMGALRLARFNIDDRQTTSFIGLPIPANALLWIGLTGWMLKHGYPGDVEIIIEIIAGALLMVCDLPMFSLKFKNFSLRENFRRYFLIVAAILFIITDGIAGLMWTVLFYLVLSVVDAMRADRHSKHE